MVETEADCNQHWVRRSVRAAGASALDSAHVVKLLEQIRCVGWLVAWSVGWVIGLLVGFLVDRLVDWLVS